MEDKYYSISQLMEICGKKSRKKFRENYILPALDEGALESFYDIFTAQEMFDLWQCVNYRFYICNANPLASKGIVMANAKTLVENIIESADSAMKNRSIAATLRFGHDGNVIPLVQLVFFENKSGDVLVKFLHNEKEVHIPVKTDIWPYYHWNEVKEYYQKRLSTLP